MVENLKDRIKCKEIKKHETTFNKGVYIYLKKCNKEVNIDKYDRCLKK